MPGRNALVAIATRRLMGKHNICTLGDVKPCQIWYLDVLIFQLIRRWYILIPLSKIPISKDAHTNSLKVNVVVENINDIIC